MRRRSRSAREESAPLPAGGTLTGVTPDPRRPGRVTLWVDGAPVLEVDAGVAAELGLRPGRAVDPALLAAAQARDLEARALADALAFLAARPRTRQEVERRLARRGYPPAAAAAAVHYLLERGWLDDREYARLYVRQQLEGRQPPGERRLAADLLRRGVDPETVAAVLAEVRPETDALAAAVAVARRRLERSRPTDGAVAARRLYGYLARRGYGTETIQRALRTVLGEAALAGGCRRRPARGPGPGTDLGADPGTDLGADPGADLGAPEDPEAG